MTSTEECEWIDGFVKDVYRVLQEIGIFNEVVGRLMGENSAVLMGELDAERDASGISDPCTRLKMEGKLGDGFDDITEPVGILSEASLDALKELTVWSENWLPDEAKDQGAREVLRAAKLIVEKIERATK